MALEDEGALCDAAGNGNLDFVRQLIKAGCDPSRGDYDRRTPLHIAAANGHQKVGQRKAFGVHVISYFE